MPIDPHDPVAEQSVLGSLLSDPDSWDAVSDILRPEMFHGTANQIVFGAIEKLVASKRPVDATTVASQVQTEHVADLAPLEYVLKLSTSTGSTINVRHYAETVRSKWALRERRRAHAEALNDGDEEGSIEEKLAGDAQRLLAIETGKTSTARKASSVLLERMEELEKEQKESRWKRQVPTGIRELDAVLNGLEPGELVLFGARPSVGKSAMAVAVSEHLGSVGIPTQIFWLEDYARQWATRVISRRSVIPAALLRHGSNLRKEHWSSAMESLSASAEWPIWIDDAHGLTARQISQRMRRAHREHGVRVFITDHFGEMGLDAGQRWGDRHDLALGDALKIYRDTAADLGAVPIIMAQLNRGPEHRNDAPKLSDIFGTGIAEQVVRVAVMLHRPDRDNQNRLQAIVEKNTNGPKGVIELHWEADTMSIRSRPEARMPVPVKPVIGSSAAWALSGGESDD